MTGRDVVFASTISGTRAPRCCTGKVWKLDHIQDVLGHSSPTVTKLIYVDVTKKVRRSTADRLDFLFEEPDEADGD